MGKTNTVDNDLVVGLKLAKSKRARFALILKGSNDGALIIAKAKVPPTDIAAAKKRSGGSAVVRGFCQFEDGKYFFDTAKEAPATAAQAVKIIAKRDAGMSVHAEFRVSNDPELLADEGDATGATAATNGAATVAANNSNASDGNSASDGNNPDASPAAQPVAPSAPAASQAPAALQDGPASQASATSNDGAEATKRLTAMTADIKAALAGPNQARVKTLFVAVSGQIKNKDFAQANLGLDELEPLVRPVQAAATPPPAQDGAALSKRLNAMTPDIKAALAGPNQARVKSLFVSVSGQIKNQAFAQASQSLDELQSLIAPSSASGSPASAATDAAAEWKKKLAEWTPLIKAVISAKGANAAAITKRLTDAIALSKSGDFVQALAKLTECHGLALAGAPAASRQGDFASSPAASESATATETAAANETNVANEAASEAPSNQTISPEFAERWKQAASAWQNAVDTIESQLEKLRGVILSVNEEQDPNIAHLIPQLQEIASGGLSQVVGGQRVAMQVAIGNLNQAADDAARVKFISAAHAVVKQVRLHVASDEGVAVCEDNGFGVTVAIRSELGGALSLLDETLGAALAG